MASSGCGMGKMNEIRCGSNPPSWSSLGRAVIGAIETSSSAHSNAYSCPLRDLPDGLASRAAWVKLDIWITSKPLDETHKCLSRFSDLKATPSRAGSSVAVRS
jgi:hypothetical protein